MGLFSSFKKQEEKPAVQEPVKTDRVIREKQQELIDKRAKVMMMGGEKAIEKQHSRGKLTARERLNLLFDEGTFTELNLFVKHRCTVFGMEKKDIAADAVVTGFGKVNGRLVYAYAQDFTSVGGSVGEMTGKKTIRLMEEANKVGAPIVGMCDGAGGRIQEGMDAIYYSAIMYNNVMASGRVPQVSAIMGPCVGGAAYSPALTDFIIATEKTSSMFITGPKVIEQVTGEKVDKKTFGTAQEHMTVTGVVNRTATDDVNCIEQVKLYLSYFPQNCKEQPPIVPCDQDPDALVYELDTVLPENSKQPYDVREVIRLIADKDSMFEISPLFAQNIVTTLARINGRSVGFVANNPSVMAGTLDINASDKFCHFVSVCDAFNIPLIYLADTPGFMPGKTQEHGGIIRHGAKVLYANATATVPKIRLTLRKLYGGATPAMCDYGMNPDYTISWPSAEEATMGAEGAAAIIFAKEIAQAADPEAVRAQRIAEYEKNYNNPYFKASRLETDIIIEPNETRRLLIRLLEAIETKEEKNPEKKHSIFPC